MVRAAGAVSVDSPDPGPPCKVRGVDKVQVAVVLKRFESPDETRIMEKGRFELVRIGGLTIGRATYEPVTLYLRMYSSTSFFPKPPPTNKNRRESSSLRSTAASRSVLRGFAGL